MATYTRPAKTVSGDGGTSYVAGNTLPASELNADFDNLITNVINGGIDEDNIDPTAQIPNSVLVDIDGTKVVDHADNATVYHTATTPGDTASPSLPTDLEEELERIRYRIHANNHWVNTPLYMDSVGSLATASWTEPGPIGRNLLPNPGFEVQSGAANSAPDGWTLINTPTIAIEAPVTADDAIGLEKRSLNISSTAGSAEGISVVIGGLKASQKYLIGCSYKRTNGGVTFATVNALASGDYQNLSVTDSTGTGLETVNMIFKTNADADDVTFKITLGTSGTEEFDFHYCWMYELNDGVMHETPHLPTVTADHTTSPDNHLTNVDDWANISELTLAQYIPTEGYRLVYDVVVSYGANSAGSGDKALAGAFRIQQKIDAGAAATVEGPYSIGGNVDANAGETVSGTMCMSYMLDNPTPGSTYTFTTDLYLTDDVSNSFTSLDINPAVANGTAAELNTVSRARLYFERI